LRASKSMSPDINKARKQKGALRDMGQAFGNWRLGFKMPNATPANAIWQNGPKKLFSEHEKEWARTVLQSDPHQF
jgi:hypothetical protein